MRLRRERSRLEDPLDDLTVNAYATYSTTVQGSIPASSDKVKFDG